MRVLVLAHSFPRFPGDAAGSFILRLAVALGGHGVETRVVAPAAPGLPARSELEGVPIERFRYAPRAWETLAYTGNMMREARRTLGLALAGFVAGELVGASRAQASFRPALLHAHWWFPSGLVAAAAAPAGLPIVTTMHGTDVRLGRDVSVLRPLLRYVVRRSAAVTTVSSWLSQQLVAAVPGARPEAMPMPARTDLFVPGGERREGHLLFVGRPSRQKGLEYLLTALSRMARRATLDVVGQGTPEEEGRVRRTASAAGVADRVRWVGALPQPRLVDSYRSATALVVPSTEEGLGMVAVEALLCETPVVAFASGGLTDVVREGVTGVLVPVGNVDALARALDDLLADQERRGRLAREGRRFAMSTFSPDAVAEKYAALYRRVAGAAPR